MRARNPNQNPWSINWLEVVQTQWGHPAQGNPDRFLNLNVFVETLGVTVDNRSNALYRSQYEVETLGVTVDNRSNALYRSQYEVETLVITVDNRSNALYRSQYEVETLGVTVDNRSNALYRSQYEALPNCESHARWQFQSEFIVGQRPYDSSTERLCQNGASDTS